MAQAMTLPDGPEAEARAICDAGCELADDKPLSIACHCVCRAALRARTAERDEARRLLGVDARAHIEARQALRDERDRLAAETARLTAVYHLEREEIMSQRDRLAERVRAAGPIVQAAQRWGELQTARGLEAMSYPHTAKIIEAEKALIGLLALQAGARGREP